MKLFFNKKTNVKTIIIIVFLFCIPLFLYFYLLNLGRTFANDDDPYILPQVHENVEKRADRLLHQVHETRTT